LGHLAGIVAAVEITSLFVITEIAFQAPGIQAGKYLKIPSLQGRKSFFGPLNQTLHRRRFIPMDSSRDIQGTGPFTMVPRFNEH
jgi:hypothetical protein